MKRIVVDESQLSQVRPMSEFHLAEIHRVANTVDAVLLLPPVKYSLGEIMLIDPALAHMRWLRELPTPVVKRVRERLPRRLMRVSKGGGLPSVAYLDDIAIAFGPIGSRGSIGDFWESQLNSIGLVAGYEGAPWDGGGGDIGELFCGLLGDPPSSTLGVVADALDDFSSKIYDVVTSLQVFPLRIRKRAAAHTSFLDYGFRVGSSFSWVPSIDDISVARVAFASKTLSLHFISAFRDLETALHGQFTEAKPGSANLLGELLDQYWCEIAKSYPGLCFSRRPEKP